MAEDAETFIQEHGEQYRLVIERAIEFLDANEPKWNLPNPFNRRRFIQAVIDRG